MDFLLRIKKYQIYTLLNCIYHFLIIDIINFIYIINFILTTFGGSMNAVHSAVPTPYVPKVGTMPSMQQSSTTATLKEGMQNRDIKSSKNGLMHPMIQFLENAQKQKPSGMKLQYLAEKSKKPTGVDYYLAKEIVDFMKKGLEEQGSFAFTMHDVTKDLRERKVSNAHVARRTSAKTLDQLLQKNCGMDSISSIKSFNVDKNSVELLVEGKCGNKNEKALFIYNNETLYRYCGIPDLSDCEPREPYLSKQLFFSSKKHEDDYKKITNVQFTYRAKPGPFTSFYQRSTEARLLANKWQKEGKKGSTLLGVSDIYGLRIPESLNGMFTSYHIMPLISDYNAAYLFLFYSYNNKNLTSDEKIEIIRRVVRDNFVTAELFKKEKQYFLTDQKLENSIPVVDRNFSYDPNKTTVDEMRFAQIDIEDPVSIDDYGYMTTFPHPEFKTNPFYHLLGNLQHKDIDPSVDFSRKEELTLVQLRNFFIMMINAYCRTFFDNNKFDYVKIQQSLTTIPREKLYDPGFLRTCADKILHENGLFQQLANPTSEDTSKKDGLSKNMASVILQIFDTVIKPILKEFGIENEDDLHCIFTLLFAPHKLKEPNSYNKDCDTPEEKDEEFLNKKITQLYDILKKAIEVEKYTEPHIATQRKELQLPVSSTAAEKILMLRNLKGVQYC